tara:strand:+ start:3346 stop:3852 length:507 start_codon:yes stop_codon:yes gene_type:complete
MLKPAAFLDRDGVINVDKEYVYKKEDFEWIQDSKEAIKYLNDKDYHVIVITNQSGIARKYYTEEDMLNLHIYINNELKNIDAHIDEFFYSPYHPDIKNMRFQHLEHLRKPNPGMLEAASKKWKIDKINSFMIGDKDTDIECAKRFGVPGYLFKGGSLLDFIISIDKKN